MEPMMMRFNDDLNLEEKNGSGKGNQKNIGQS